MKLIKPSSEILEQKPGLEGIYEQIELAGRTCYKSQRKEGTTAKDFVNRMIASQHCYTGDSEVLTENGWIKWKDYRGEKVAVINNNRQFIGYEIPLRVVSHKYSGNFYEYPELGIKVTDGHNMFGMFRDSKHNFYNENLYELFSCRTYYKDNNGRKKTLGERTFKVPTNCVQPLSTDPFYELVGFWLGDGCVNETVVNKLTFHLKKERKIQYLQQLCSNLGFNFEIGKSNYYKVYSPNIGKLFNSNYYRGIKIIEEELNPIQIHSVIQGLINSDGSYGVNTKTITFTNTSKSIIDWILRYAPLAGYNVTDCGICHYTENHHACYKIFLKTTQYIINNDSRKKNKKVIITNEKLDVYCVTVSTGLILIRGTNGQTSICGNCAMLEHGTVYLKIRKGTYAYSHYVVVCEPDDDFMSSSRELSYRPYTKVNIQDDYIYVTTNYRHIIEHGWLDDLKYLCEPTEFHEKRVTVRFTTDRGVSHEFVRHRVFSFAQESTRYCNYSKDKFGSELTFIIPSWLSIEEGSYGVGHSFGKGHFYECNENRIYCDEENKEEFFKVLNFLKTLNLSSQVYMSMLNAFGLTPQQARQVLPNALKTELVMTGFVSDWQHFFRLRTSIIAETGMPHPDASTLADPLYKEFIKRSYIEEV